MTVRKRGCPTRSDRHWMMDSKRTWGQHAGSGVLAHAMTIFYGKVIPAVVSQLAEARIPGGRECLLPPTPPRARCPTPTLGIEVPVASSHSALSLHISPKAIQLGFREAVPSRPGPVPLALP